MEAFSNLHAYTWEIGELPNSTLYFVNRSLRLELGQSNLVINMPSTPRRHVLWKNCEQKRMFVYIRVIRQVTTAEHPKIRPDRVARGTSRMHSMRLNLLGFMLHALSPSQNSLPR